uniref:HTH CENPB-type domain-containing protein n=1 Tax=Ditylenchus dipsaci TaxID=166011 RepID=A0A915EKQ7_9BILA
MADTMENTLQDTEEKHELDDTNMSLLLNDSQDSQTNRKRHNHYDVTTKLEAIQWARTISINSASRQYGVDRKCVKRWMVQEDELHNLLNTPSGSKRKRLYGGGRSVLHPDLDEELASWVREMKQNKESISRRIISNKAMQLFSNTEVKISNGWLSSFMKRHNFMQQRDTAPRLIPNQKVMLNQLLIFSWVWKKGVQQPFLQLLGIGFDHVELRFFKGEEAIPLVVPNIRGQVYPVLYVEDNAILDAKFSSFDSKMPFGYEEIMIEQTLL